MIPPCDPSILESNPQFKRLYENLTTSVFNPDGSTRAHAAVPTREAMVEDLKQCQVQSAKKRIKTHMLRQLAFASDSEVRDECRDNLAIISLYLETPPVAIELDSTKNEGGNADNNDALSLLAPEFETFYSHIPTIILPFSNLLSSTLHDLRTIATVTAESDGASIAAAPGRAIPVPSRSNHNARARARDRRVRTSIAPLPPLSSQLRDRVRALRHAQLSELPASRRQMATTAAELLAVQAQFLERTVVILERVKHGALARATKAKAEHLATVAQGVEGKLEVTKLEIASTLYTPETLAALTRYRQHLQKTKDRLEEQRMAATEELKAYGDVDVADPTGVDATETSADGSTLAQIARRYGALAQEVEMVEMEIARLGE